MNGAERERLRAERNEKARYLLDHPKCDWCGQQFTAAKHNGPQQLYCSSTCRKAAWAGVR